MACSLRRPNNTNSYSALLFMQLHVSFVNCRCAVYLALMSKGDTKTAIAPTQVLLQAPSQYTYHGVSKTGPLVLLEGSIQSVMKSAKTCNLMAFLVLKSITCSDNSIAHFPILPKESQLLKISFSG
jgi:hypothetical protein